MQTLIELNENFAIPGVLVFEEGQGGLLRALVTSEACDATLYLQGAHLTHWQPAGQKPALFLSERSHFAPGKAIRGGVPIVFPWFGARSGERTDGPSHGFARTEVWEVAFAAVSGDDVHLTLTLGPNETSRALGYDNFRVAYEVAMGSSLTMRLSVANQGDAPMHFEEALHSYLAVGDAERVRIYGLAKTAYLDKTDGFKRKRQMEEALALSGMTDRPYLDTKATVTLDDAAMGRTIDVAKQGSKTTVVWNPWSTGAAMLTDMGAEEWRRMMCVEAANAADNALTLRPREAHTMEARISVERFHEMQLEAAD